jgi:hypothetical protein
MAEQELTPEAGAEIVPDNTESKTPEVSPDAEVAPEETDKPTEAPDEEDIDDVLALLNIVEQETGGKGEIKDIPPELRNSIKYIYDKLVFVRELFEDPLWKAILDDMADQKEDGEVPSAEVAIVRNIPLDKLQQLAESEDYAGAQNELASNLDASKKSAEDDAMLEENFNASQQAGTEYAKEMGYDEDEKNALFQVVLELFNIMGDGKLTKEEWAKVDKMRNYDKDTEALKSQIEAQGETKEVLPDQASMEATMKPAPPEAKPKSAPGLGSMAAYQNPATDITQVGARKRGRV